MTKEQIFNIQSEADFNHLALQMFHYQRKNCKPYQHFISHLPIDIEQINDYREIPFLPIDFFKSHRISTQDKEAEVIFSSSGTTQNRSSQHPVTDISWYEKSYQTAFSQFYGKVQDYCVLALLPSYLEREGSSLIYMVDDLIRKSQHPKSGFFLRNHAELHQVLLELKAQNTPTILIGVSFALLDFVENYTVNFPKLIVMETGGMKGQRKEIIRNELHQTLIQGFGVENIHAEYGMTELLSQAYSQGNGQFLCPAWMKISIRDTNDPLSLLPQGQTGGINVIDLANIHSCAFIATQDLGKMNGKYFEVLGRFDHSDIRGCNLMVG